MEKINCWYCKEVIYFCPFNKLSYNDKNREELHVCN